jgi:hypothetical protein
MPVTTLLRTREQERRLDKRPPSMRHLWHGSP